MVGDLRTFLAKNNSQTKKILLLSRLTYQQSLCGTGHIVRIIISAIRNLTMQVGAISHSISDLEGCTGSGSEARANPSPLSACTPTDKFAKCELRVHCSPSKGRRDALALPIRSHPPSSEWPRRGSLIASPLSPGHRSSSASQHAGRKPDSSPTEYMNGGPSHQPPFFSFLYSFLLFFGGRGGGGGSFEEKKRQQR